MRALELTFAVVVVGVALSGCGKSSTSTQAPSGQTASTAAPELSDADKKALQASFPAPYNTADLANGESKFALCSSCHTLTADGPNMTGPNLHGIFGRKAATIPKFTYSDPLKAAGWTWDADHIDKWITDPKGDVPGTKMTFVGLKDPKDRTDIIAYLMVETGFRPK